MSSTPVVSAGVLLVRPVHAGSFEVLAGHMGGPFWARKDEGAWSVPKGLVEADEDHWTAAQREFTEETGLPLPPGPSQDLGTLRAGGKTLHLWRRDADLDPTDFSPGTFEMPWPPRSGRVQTFPELDRLEWLPLAAAARLLTKSQRPFLERGGLIAETDPAR